MAPKTDVIEQLRERVRELEEENERLKREKVDFAYGFEFFRNETKRHESELSKQLAASQAYAEQLRDSIVSLGNPWSANSVSISEAVKIAATLPRDTSALDAYVAKKVNEALK